MQRPATTSTSATVPTRPFRSRCTGAGQCWLLRVQFVPSGPPRSPINFARHPLARTPVAYTAIFPRCSALSALRRRPRRGGDPHANCHALYSIYLISYMQPRADVVVV